MRALIVLMVALAFLFAPVSSIAKKGPSDKAYEQASDKAKFKRDQGSVDKSGKKTDKKAAKEKADTDTSDKKAKAKTKTNSKKEKSEAKSAADKKEKKKKTSK